MKKIILLFCLICLSCTSRQPFIIHPYSGSRTFIIKNLEDQEIKREKIEVDEGIFYPDPTKGYIENRAYPYIPKVWMVRDGRKIILIGPAEGPPQFWEGEIREFSFSPGIYILHIEKWRKMPRGWEKMEKTEVIKLSVAQSEQQLSAVGHYGWWITINPTSVYVH